jgi:hypothetical protein
LRRYGEGKRRQIIYWIRFKDSLRPDEGQGENRQFRRNVISCNRESPIKIARLRLSVCSGFGNLAGVALTPAVKLLIPSTINNTKCNGGTSKQYLFSSIGSYGCSRKS